MDLKTNLKKLLDTNGLNVLKLSKLTGIPKSTLADWMAGSLPKNINQIKTVADYFNVTIDVLVFGTSMSAKKSNSIELIPFGKFDVYLKKTE